MSPQKALLPKSIKIIDLLYFGKFETNFDFITSSIKLNNANPIHTGGVSSKPVNKLLRTPKRNKPSP